MTDVTRDLARFGISLRYEDLPEATLAAARCSLINFLGVTIAGARHEASESAIAAARRLGATGTAALLGRIERLDPMSAALVNGIASAVLDFDSTQLKKTNIHPNGPVVPALFAAAAVRSIDLREFMVAYVLGVEVSCRIANVVFGQANPGWHVTGAAGGVGAAVAVGRVIGLNEKALVSAIGIAANQAGGLREMYGTMSKALIPGRAAQSGLMAAFMAAEGFDGPDRPIEGRKGLARVFGSIEDCGAIAADFGGRFEIEFNTHKPYPCAIVTHATIDAGLALREGGLDPDAIEAIEIHAPPIALELAGVAEPRTELECKFSLAHCVAIALARGRPTVLDFGEEVIRDQRLSRTRARTSLVPAPGYRKEEALLRVFMADGARLESHIPFALGSLGNPMREGDVVSKFRTITGASISSDAAASIIDHLLGDASGEVESILALACPV